MPPTPLETNGRAVQVYVVLGTFTVAARAIKKPAYPVFVSDLGMHSAPFEPFSVYLVKENTLGGRTGLATNDIGSTGSSYFFTAEEQATAKFQDPEEQ